MYMKHITNIQEINKQMNFVYFAKKKSINRNKLCFLSVSHFSSTMRLVVLLHSFAL